MMFVLHHLNDILELLMEPGEIKYVLFKKEFITYTSDFHNVIERMKIFINQIICREAAWLSGQCIGLVIQWSWV